MKSAALSFGSYCVTPAEIVITPRMSPVDFFTSFFGFHLAADLVGEMDRAHELGLRQDHHEFLAAIARRGIAALDVLGQAIRHQAQDLVAGLMPPSVVEFLETVDVAHDERQRFAGFDGLLDAVLQRGVERLAVGDAGELVGEAFLSHRFQPVAQFVHLARRGLKLQLQRLGSRFHRARRADDPIDQSLDRFFVQLGMAQFAGSLGQGFSVRGMIAAGGFKHVQNGIEFGGDLSRRARRWRRLPWASGNSAGAGWS